MDTWILLSTLAIATAVYYYFFKNLNFFKKHGILHIPPWPVVGNMGPAFLRGQAQLSATEIIQRSYDLNSDAKYVGIFEYMNPVLLIRDSDLIKSIGVKNFDSFTDHRTLVDERNDPIVGRNILSLRGDKWRDMRALLTPVFTSSKMKTMFKLMSDCAVDFTEFLSKLPSDKSVIEMKDCCTRYTNDVIATCAFGISVDSMRNPENEFYLNGKVATTFDRLRLFQLVFIRSMPVISKMLGITFISNPVRKFFNNLVRSTIEARDKQNIVRPDMLQLMMESRGKEGRELTFDDMTAQAFGFFFGGFDTVSSLMCFVVHEIAVNPDVQLKLRNDVDEVLKKTNGELTYEALNSLKYLDAVINETLRLWPIAAMIDRLCVQDFELPPALPGDKPFVMKKGTYLWFPIYSLNRDPKYFEKPDEFIPERFLEDNKKILNSGAYIPFGIGPRMCIGNRFALLEIKVMIFHLLARCELKLCAKTSHPLKLSKVSFGLQAEGGFWLEIQPRSDAHTSVSTSVNGDATIDHI